MSKENFISDSVNTFFTVESAEETILSTCKDFGSEKVHFTESLGRVLAQPIYADADFPPFNRSTMDGIAIAFDAYEKGNRDFKIKGIQAAGDSHIVINHENECIEVMTGASLHDSVDTVIRYEDLSIDGNSAQVLKEDIRRGQNIHTKGIDKKKGGLITNANQEITPAIIAACTSTGLTQIEVKKLPKVLVISTGNELVEPEVIPNEFQIRHSNRYVIQSALLAAGLPSDALHLEDDRDLILKHLKEVLTNYDAIIMCGGVSKGKFDFVPDALQELGVRKLFHNVLQRPGKPFWFGTKESNTIFAFPGNPVSVFMCLHRYFFSWLQKSLGVEQKKYTAILNADVEFKPGLQYFLPVKLEIIEGKLIAQPVRVNGSGDFINLLQADAFMELPASREVFQKYEIYPVWPFKKLIS